MTVVPQQIPTSYGNLRPQALANAGWALATPAALDEALTSMLADSTLLAAASSSTQDMANGAREFANPSACSTALAGAAALASCAKASHLDLATLSVEDIHYMALDLNALIWSFSFISCLVQISEALQTLPLLGREVDRRISLSLGGSGSGGQPALMAPGRAPMLMRQYDGYSAAYEAIMVDRPPTTQGRHLPGASSAPELVVSRHGMVVVLKPAGWEVDTTPGSSVDSENRLLLSSYLQRTFSKEAFPLVHLPDFGHGFLHRLDVPSSGLVLAGTTFEGLYSLRSQLNTYRLQRDYITVCHNLSQPSHKVDARVDATSTHSLRSVVRDIGRPAASYFSCSAHLLCKALEGSNLCIVAVRIRTGRRHQIRTHTRYIGHPTAADCWYCPSACILATETGPAPNLPPPTNQSGGRGSDQREQRSLDSMSPSAANKLHGSSAS
ncbi:unnamed protein product [Polarella glacialis]|uniref:Pseudouridine synthase RsuA/RluA-like domain-containing protein n=1 Tax=Polarella glacialis TaxID=89957 RepID=A0A813ECC0_POLGL|nr:unnamed protein product [Polarella glacialis]